MGLCRRRQLLASFESARGEGFKREAAKLRERPEQPSAGAYRLHGSTLPFQLLDCQVVWMMVSKSEYLGLNPRRRSAREASATSVAGSPGRLGARTTGTRMPVTRSMVDRSSR